MKGKREQIFIVCNNSEVKNRYIEYFGNFFGNSIETARFYSRGCESYIRLKNGIVFLIFDLSFNTRGYKASRICIADEVKIDERMKSEFEYLTAMSYRNKKIKYIRNKYDDSFEFIRDLLSDGEEDSAILKVTKDLSIEIYSLKQRIQLLETEISLLKSKKIKYKINKK